MNIIDLQSTEKLMKDIYLEVFKNRTNNSHPLFKAIKRTTDNIYGNEIIKINSKYIKEISVNLVITNKALSACQTSTAFLNLLNDEYNSASNLAEKKLLNLIQETIKEECEVDLSISDIETALYQFNLFNFEGITLHELADWQYLSFNNNSIFLTNDFCITVTLIKYCNVVISNEFKQYIKLKFKENK